MYLGALLTAEARVRVTSQIRSCPPGLDPAVSVPLALSSALSASVDIAFMANQEAPEATLLVKPLLVHVPVRTDVSYWWNQVQFLASPGCQW